MKVAIIGQKGIPAKFGGVEKHVEDLAIRLAELGHEVSVYVRPNYTDPDLHEYEGVKLIHLPNIPTKHLDAITHTFRACLDVVKRDVDVIHFHSIGPSFFVWLVKLLKPRTPVVATFHTRCYEHQKWGRFAKFCLRTAEKICCNLSDKTIAVSKTLAEYARKKYHRPIVYIPNGVKIRQVSGSDKLKKWNLEDGNYLVAVSRLVRHKGIHYLIEAFKKIETDMKLVIVGDSAFTDSYVEELKSISATDERIIFTGNQTGEALEQLFSRSYLFIQPSESEGLSIALLEAMSYGKAALISDIPENLEALGEEADHDLVFKNKSITDLREKMAKLLAMPEKVKEHGEINQRRVDYHYNWENIAAEVTQVYDQAVIEKKHSNRFLRLETFRRMLHLFF